MKLRLMVEIDADPSTVEALAAMQEYGAVVDVDPHDGYKPMEGRLVGAVPVEDGVMA